MDETPEFGTEKLRRAWATTESNPHDMEAWSLIIRDAQNRAIDSARPIFERLVTTFPTTGKFWKMYIEQEMRSYNFEKVEKVCLTHCFKCYLFTIKACILTCVVYFSSSFESSLCFWLNPKQFKKCK
ncbi:cleavage stimulation factor subunit 3 isoform X2 [Penaeus vannamei]|uniref:cleavage stimulation factor subunit 3 isoform X2 n=1 Tax=Penaeus vannamei TaxID=6689 RepID=UPI00387F3B54